MAVALRVLVQRQSGFRLGSRRALPELDWRQLQVDSSPAVPGTRPQQQEMSMQRANSLALEKARPQAQEKKPKAKVKLQAPLLPANLPAQESLSGRYAGKSGACS